MNTNHAGAIASGLRAVDKLLGEIEAALIGPSSASPFVAPPGDLTPSKRQLLLANVREIRAAMVDALGALGLKIAPAAGRVRGTIQTSLTFAEIALQEIAPERLRGYGPLPSQDAIAVERVLSDMARRLREARAATDDEADFAARLDALDRAAVDASEVRAIEQVIARRGLVELRGLLASVLARLEHPAFEIAVFGRVSCGKSSLLNAALRVDVLPIGALPVTAVPTRIERAAQGAESLAIRFADGRTEASSLDRIAEYVTEEHNPGNEKGVASITARVSSGRLEPGVALVDTPGVSALHAAGSREAYAYLPRCDLGVLAVDAGALLSREDVHLLRTLRESEIDARVVITKTDRLSPADRDSLVEYLRREIAREIGIELAVRPTSSVGPGVTPTAQWFDEDIAPLVARGRALAEASTRGKIARLRGSAIANLRASLGAADPARTDEQRAADRVGGEAERILEASRRECDEISSQVRDAAAIFIRRAARAVLDANDDPREAVARALSAAVDDAAAPIVRQVDDARDRLRSLVTGAGWPAEGLRVDRLGVPALGAMPALEEARLRPPRWWPKPLQRSRAQLVLVDDLGGPLSEALSRYASDLRAWARGEIERLSAQLSAALGPTRARPAASADRASIFADLRTLGCHDGDEAGRLPSPPRLP